MKKILYALTALVVAITALAKAEKTLVVTLTDGTSKEYKLSEIEKLTFSEIPDATDPDEDDDVITLPEVEMQPATTGPYAVGDFYSDGVTQGVVASVDHTGTYGTLVYVADMPKQLRYSKIWDITDANDENDGTVNMAIIGALDPGYNDYPAFKACSMLGEKYYLPAQKELQTLRGNLSKVNATLTARGFEAIDESTVYWSSTECDQFMDAMAYTAYMDFPGMFGVDKMEKHPVRAFAQFGEKPEPKFTVGNLYDKDGVTGVIYWVAEDDSYARIIALEDQSTTWGALGTAVGTKSTESGDVNMKTALKADPTLASLPAFKACADKGSGWFLPAQAELKYLATNKAEINAALTANGGSAMTSAYYWTSTEYTADAANSAVAVLFTDGSVLGSSKSVERNVRPIAYVGQRPADATTFAVGDLYYEGEQVIGVVCQVSDDGTSGRIIALENAVMTGRINAMWDLRANASEYVDLGANSADDGELNMAAARANDPELANLPAFQVCAALGDGWYLPAINEMAAVIANLEVLEPILLANGGKRLGTGNTWSTNEFWSSTQDTATPAERAQYIGTKEGETGTYRKYFYLMVRPMKKF